MKLQELYSITRQAIDDYQMIEEGDRIAIGISGGKDSLALLYSLAGLRKFYPNRFDIVGICVDLGYGYFPLDDIEELCKTLNVTFTIVKTDIADIVRQHIEKGTYCSLCAKLRKGALHDEALKQGCNKIAYAHHMDDIIETMFLSLIYEGKFYSFSPITYLSKSNLTMIRPLMYASEADIIGFRNKYDLKCVKNPCPHDGITRREYVKQLVRQIHRENPGAKKRIFHAICNGNIEGWPINVK